MSNESSDEFRQPNGRFAKGNPGGPGRPRARDRIETLDQRVAEAGPELIDAALRVATAGNVRALEMLLDRIWPASRGRPVQVEVPEIQKTADLVPAGAAVTNAVMSGEMTPEEGAAAARILSAHENLIATVDIDRRFRVLEEEYKRRAALEGGRR